MRAAAGGRRKLAAGITLQCPPTSAIFPIKYFHSHLQLYFVQYLDLCEIEDWGTSVCSKAFKTPLSVWNFIDSGWFRFGGKKFIATGGGGGVASMWFHIRALIARDGATKRPWPWFGVWRNGVRSGVCVGLPGVWPGVWWWWRCMKCLGEDCLTNILLASTAWNSIFWRIQYPSQFVAASAKVIFR